MVDDELLTLPAAARALGVHYMTAYRYIRTGRLAAVKVGAQWRVTPGALNRLQRHRSEMDPGADAASADTGPADIGLSEPAGIERSQRLHQRLVAGDEAGSWRIIEDALAAGASPGSIHVDLLGPALASVGARWAAGELAVSSERRATRTATRLVGRLGPRFARRGAKRGAIVLGSVLGDEHALPSAMMADLVRERGLDVIDLGPDVAPFIFGEVCPAPEVGAVGICTSVAGNDHRVRATTQHLRARGCSIPIVVGGGAVDDHRHARRLGSTGWAAGSHATADLLVRLAHDHLTGQR